MGAMENRATRAASWDEPCRAVRPEAVRGWREPGGWLRHFVTLAFVCAIAAVLALVTFHPTAEAANEAPNLVDPTQAADNSFIYDTTVASLYSQASLYNDRTVQVIGEVIGDRINASDNLCWVTLTETVATDKSTISVLMSYEQSDQIDHYGRYGVQGSTMQVRGTYHQACDEHDGLPDIHATNSSVIGRGEDTPDSMNFSELFLGLGLIVLGVALMSAFYIARERTR